MAERDSCSDTSRTTRPAPRAAYMIPVHFCAGTYETADFSDAPVGGTPEPSYWQAGDPR